MARILLALLSVTLLLWLGLGIFRAAGTAEIEAMQRAYSEHYRVHGDSDVAVEWDFETNELVEVPDSNLRGSGGFVTYGVRAAGEDAPLEAYGLVLARVPAHWFHGIFGLAALFLAALYMRARS